MNTHSTVLDNASAEATTPDRILQTALAAWRQGSFVEVVDQFSEQFTFADHALGLEFKDKGRLTEFLAKIGERFPDAERKANTIFSSGDRVITRRRCFLHFWKRAMKDVSRSPQRCTSTQKPRA